MHSIRIFLFCIIICTFSIVGVTSCGDDDDDESGDDEEEAYCDIDGEGLVEVPFSSFSSDCNGAIGVAFTLENVLANDTLTIFEARGSYSINNDNTYYLRGDGLGDALCFDRISNSGSYSSRNQSLSCVNHVSFDVVTSTNPDAVAFCTLSFVVDISCDNPDGDDDDFVDDDDDDDDSISCADAWSFFDDCGWYLEDEEGNAIDIADLIVWCEAGEAFYGDTGYDCLVNNLGNCDGAADCISDVLDNYGDDDDDTTDDDDDDDAPVLSSGGWDPAVTTLGEFTGYDERMYYSALFWSVCDVNNDLLPEGEVFVYQSGTTSPFMQGELTWADLNNPPDSDLGNVGDCNDPVQTGINVIFAPESDPGTPGTYCADIEATDNAGNFSNLLTNLCVTHNP